MDNLLLWGITLRIRQFRRQGWIRCDGAMLVETFRDSAPESMWRYLRA